MKARTFEIGPKVLCDLDRLINSRLLVQANSGGGKSWALRRILEQTHGQVQQLVIDPEGEFSSLREKFDYVLAAPSGGDTAADPRTAALLAERLLTLGVSAILDIYELDPAKRIAFVKLFLTALVNAPKQLWHPVLVVLDEAHVFCPEKGAGEADSSDAVKALCSRGRKRGFCAVLATQRLSKLAKDAAAECNNKLIGLASLDVDIGRAGAELGFARGDYLQLRSLDAGEFFAFGPAIARTVTKVKVGPVQSRHPEAGSKLAAVVPPPTEKVRALLPQLSDLPAEAEAREKTVADLKKEIATLKRQPGDDRKRVVDLERQLATATTDLERAKTAASKADHTELKAELVKYRRALESAMKILVKVKAVDFDVETADGAKALEQAVAAAVRQVTAPIEKRVTALAERVEGFKLAARQAQAEIEALLAEKIDLTVQVRKSEPFLLAPARSTRPDPAVRAKAVARPDGFVVTVPMQRILNALAWAEAMRMPALRKERLAFLADASPTSSSFTNNLGALRTAGLVDYPQPGCVGLTDSGRSDATLAGVPTSTDELQDMICAKLPNPQARIVRELAKSYPHAFGKAHLAEAVEASASSSSFTNNLGALRSLGLIDYPAQGQVAATPVLFLEA